MTREQAVFAHGIKVRLGDRLRRIRRDLFGEGGGPELAERLGVPARTWSNYEAGVTIPGEVLLLFLGLTAAEPRWLLTGEGRRYREDLGGVDRDASTAG